MKLLAYASLCLPVISALAYGADWSRDAKLPAEGHRANILELPQNELSSVIRAGKIHALNYPVNPTSVVLPYGPLQYLFESSDFNVSRRMFKLGAKAKFGFESINDCFEWLGLHPYPAQNGKGPYDFPYAEASKPKTPMGVELRQHRGALAFTFGCATCHVGTLFGKPVFGLTNRSQRANETFIEVKKLLAHADAGFFNKTLRTTAADQKIIQATKHRLDWVALRMPQAQGLDTSLAQVGLSLAKRGMDDYAELREDTKNNPRPSILDHMATDSKPAVWWNIKYKTRWLSDGSVVSGNPVFTNFLWNEIGRGADLHELESWFDRSKQTIDELTAAVFASEPPRYEDFFGKKAINVDVAKKGEQKFNEFCAGCHGVYKKAWEQDLEDTRTLQVIYHSQTPVINVGTDPARAKGMAGLADRLNDLALSQKIGTVIEVQQGYVPPPLVGIWARWPYFHNNAAPSLCAVLTSSNLRPKTYYANKAEDKDRDFDVRCNGYPLQKTGDKKLLFDTGKQGLSNAGHDEGIFLKNGRELLNKDEKLAIVEFLKTL